MSYLLLEKQYHQTAQEILDKLHRLKQEIKQVSFLEVEQMEERMNILQIEYYDLLNTAHMIKKYGELFG